jgi:hypothetical protein
MDSNRGRLSTLLLFNGGRRGSTSASMALLGAAERLEYAYAMSESRRSVDGVGILRGGSLEERAGRGRCMRGDGPNGSEALGLEGRTDDDDDNDELKAESSESLLK